MSAKTTEKQKPSPLRSSVERLLKNPKAAEDRRAAVVAGIVLSLLAILLAVWFWNTVTQHAEDRPTGIFLFVAPVGLMAAAITGIAGSVLLAMQKQAATGLLVFAINCGGICTLIAAINAFVAFIRRGNMGGLENAWQRFMDFNRIELGGIGISITGTLTIILIIAGISAAINKNKS